MSTRSNIKLVDNCGEILLYKHHDGSPTGEHGIIEFLKPYLKRSGKSAEWMAKLLIDETECDVSSGLHGDICYYYEVDVQQDMIKVYKRNWETDENDFVRSYDQTDMEVTC